ncbi:unnamed protein product, partial [Polarella glacialis]
ANGQRRPSSAVGAGGEAPHRRTHHGDRVSDPKSRPGSASSGGARFATTMRPVSPPTSARTGAPGHSYPGSDGLRGPSAGRPASPAGLPVQVALSNGGSSRPRTPVVQRRAPQSGGTPGTSGDGKEPSRPESASQNQDGSQRGSNSLTTVISSALDYKRFLDRRKQMIQQQVETAQQSSATRRAGQAENEADAEVARANDASSGHHQQNTLSATAPALVVRLY